MDDIITTALWASLHSGGSSANLGSVTFTENDTYTPVAPLDGWNEVTVQVPTYEEEYEEALETIAELEDQVEECTKCRENVLEALGLPPETEGCPPILDAIEELIEEEGYTFPEDVPYSDIPPVTGDNPITDTSTGQTLYCKFRTAAESIGGMKGAEAWYTDSNNNELLILGDYDDDPDIYYSGCKITMIDSTTGTVRIQWTKRSYTYPDYHFTTDTTQTVQDLTGYGATGHRYKVHNS